MPLYTPGRRRAILLLLLTSVLLLTLDLRGNAIFDGVRTGFNKFMEPLESAADVATRPIRNAWHGIMDYEKVKDENERLQDELDAQRGDQIAAQAAIQDYQALLATNDLPALADYPTVTAMVVGVSPSNLDQIVEINKGRKDDLEVGMAVTTSAGLVGKITTPLLEDRARVMLITDPRYAVPVKVVAGRAAGDDHHDDDRPAVDRAGRVGAAGRRAGHRRRREPPRRAAAAAGDGARGDDDHDDADRRRPPSVRDDDRPRDTGQFSGQGAESLPQVDLLEDTPMFGRIVVGDLIFTAGGNDSLAPPDIPIGVVRNVINRSSSAGPAARGAAVGRPRPAALRQHHPLPLLVRGRSSDTSAAGG